MLDKEKDNLAKREGDSSSISQANNNPQQDVPEVDEVVTQGQAGHMMYKNQQQKEEDGSDK